MVLSGDLDMDSALEVRMAGLKVIAGGECVKLVVDLLDVPFIDSTGIGTLIALRNATQERGIPITLLDPSDRVLKVLAITRLDAVFEVEQSTRPSGV